MITIRCGYDDISLSLAKIYMHAHIVRRDGDVLLCHRSFLVYVCDAGNRDGNKIIVPKINTLVSHSKRLENVFHSVDGKRAMSINLNFLKPYVSSHAE
jgi:hypothetical protein